MAYLHLEFYRGGGGQGKNNIVVCRLQGGPVSWIVFACRIKHDTEIQAARVDVLLTRECYKGSLLCSVLERDVAAILLCSANEPIRFSI